MNIRCSVTTAVILLSVFVMFNASVASADVEVYDNNNQYLGVMAYMDAAGIDLFIPSLAGTFRYADDYSGWCGDELEVIFESNNCTGTAYTASPYPMIYDLSDCPSITGAYKVDYSSKETITPGSYRDWNQSCATIDLPPAGEYYPYVQVQLPFTTPIVYPLRFVMRNRAVVIPLN